MNIQEKKYGDVVVYETQDYKWGVKSIAGEDIVPAGKYGWIDGFDNGLARVRTDKQIIRTNKITDKVDLEKGIALVGCDNIRNYFEKDRQEHPEQYAKWGIINEKGEEVLPLEYDEVWNFLGKNLSYTNVEKDGRIWKVYFKDLEYSDYESSYDDYEYSDSYGSNYGDFAGSYAQDVMGYSDDAIYDAFEGDPEMYWNID